MGPQPDPGQEVVREAERRKIPTAGFPSTPTALSSHVCDLDLTRLDREVELGLRQDDSRTRRQDDRAAVTVYRKKESHAVAVPVKRGEAPAHPGRAGDRSSSSSSSSSYGSAVSRQSPRARAITSRRPIEPRRLAQAGVCLNGCLPPALGHDLRQRRRRCRRPEEGAARRNRAGCGSSSSLPRVGRSGSAWTSSCPLCACQRLRTSAERARRVADQFAHATSRPTRRPSTQMMGEQLEPGTGDRVPLRSVAPRSLTASSR